MFTGSAVSCIFTRLARHPCMHPATQYERQSPVSRAHQIQELLQPFTPANTV